MKRTAQRTFSLEFVNWLLPIYAAIMSMAIEFSGANDKPGKGSNLFRSWLVAIVVVLAFYALIPESYRFFPGSPINWLNGGTGYCSVLAYPSRSFSIEI